MSPFRRLSTLVLLGLWLIGMQHCALEAAGFLHADDCGGATACCSESDPSQHDTCGLIERSSLPGAGAPLKVPAPVWQDNAWTACVLLIAPDPVPAAPEEALRATLEEAARWVPTWQFARRAAQPPRAPSRLLA